MASDFDRNVITLLIIAAIGCMFWSCFLTLLLDRHSDDAVANNIIAHHHHHHHHDGKKTTTTTMPQKQATTTLSTFFEKLCQYKITECCRNESNVSIMDDLSITLGNSIQQQQLIINNNNIHLSKLMLDDENNGNPPPSYRDPPILNCTHYPETFRVHTHPKYRVAGKQPFDQVFSGTVLSSSSKPRTMIDFIMVSYELDILEARLYEYNHIMDYFIIFESEYNHRGWKKKRFLQEALESDDTRFDPFQHKIILINVDTCPQYIKAIEKERQNGLLRSAGKDVFEIQNALRTCRWPLVSNIQNDWPEDTLVLFTDLDWFPDTSLLKHIKHCEPSTEYGYANPFHMTLSNNLYGSLGGSGGCKSASCSDTCFALHSIQRLRELNGLPEGKGFVDRALDRSNKNNKKTIPFYCGGVHMQDVSSLEALIYRDATHAEFAQIRSELLLDSKPYCDITQEFLQQQQDKLWQHPETMHWKLKSMGKRWSKAGADDWHDETGRPTKQHLESLRQCQIPFVMLEYPQAYPYAWAGYHG